MAPAEAVESKRPTHIFWIFAFLIPNLLLMAWTFRGVGPDTYIATLYHSEWPWITFLPPVALALAIVVAAIHKWSAHSPLESNSRLPSLLAIAIVFTLGMSYFVSPAIVFNLIFVALGFAIVVAAAALGLLLFDLPGIGLSRERFSSPLERIVVAGALGLGLLALSVFIAGSLGLLNAWFWRAVLLALFALNLARLKTIASELRGEARSYFQSAHPVTSGTLVVLLIYLAAHLALIWAPPVEYDILEYHLAAPAQYLRNGHISFLSENIYACMPENGEMLYLLAMTCAGSKLEGLLASHAILFCVWILSIAGVYVLVRRLIFNAERPEQPAGPAPALAALFYALIPMGTELVADFYVEQFQAFFHVSVALCGCAFLQDWRRTGNLHNGWLYLAGTLAGLCCGAKYPALLMTLAPMLVLIPGFLAASRQISAALCAGAAIGIPAAAIFSPWALRNLVASGDPLYPLGLVLQRHALAPDAPSRIDHLEVALHVSKNFDALKAAIKQVYPNLGKINEWRSNIACGPHLLSFMLPGCLCCNRPDVLFVVLFFVIDCVVWFFFTHRLNRFFYPVLSQLAVISGVGIAQLWNLDAPDLAVKGSRALLALACSVALLLMTPLSLLYLWAVSRPDFITGVETPADAARLAYHSQGDCGPSTFEAWLGINNLPAGSRVLFLGDAQTIYVDNSPAYAVVFNEHPLQRMLDRADDVASLKLELAAEGITHIYVNYSEWFRLDASYALTRETPSSPWHFARLDERTRRLLRVTLQNLRLNEYEKAWPQGVYPAYLKLAPGRYALLEKLLRENTERVAAWGDPRFPDCELRRISVVTPETANPKSEVKR